MIISINYVNVETGYVYGKRFNDITKAKQFHNSLDCPKSVEFNTGNVHHDITYKRIFEENDL